MFSRIISIIVVVNIIFTWRGLALKAPPLPSVLDSSLKCLKAGNSALFASLEAMADRPDTDLDKIRLSCLFFKVAGLCMVSATEFSSPVPEIFQFFDAIQYQHHYLLKEAALCPDILYGKLKNITLDSGIMKKEKLINIEGDNYAQCAGDALRKCMISSIIMTEHQVDMITADFMYIECMENMAGTCNTPIMRHFLGQLKAYKKHLKKLFGK